MRDVENGRAREAFRREHEVGDVDRLTRDPVLKVRRGDDVIECLSQLEAVLLRHHVFDVQRPQLGKGRRLHLRDHLLHRQVDTGAPVVFKDVRHQDVFAAFHRRGADTDQRQQRRDRPGDLLA